jgi:small-conductance mechanosensitive channel
MAELTELEEKVAEVYGLAQAAQNATEKVKGLVEDDQIASLLQRMHDEAAQAEERCAQLADSLDGKKTAIQDKARETKQEAQQMMQDYLGDDADGLDGLEFLIMAEAGELGHVEIVGAMNEVTAEPKVQELFEWAKPIQQRHFDQTREAALQLARQEAE